MPFTGAELFPGGLAFIFKGGNPICLRSVAGSGIPGVGVIPGFMPFFNCSALGIPGVGVVPFGKTPPFAGKPGTPFIGIGLPDRPGGIFAGSSFMMFALVETESGIEFEFDAAGEPQAARAKAAIKDKPTVLSIIIVVYLKELCRLGSCVPGGQRRRPNRHGQVSNKCR